MLLSISFLLVVLEESLTTAITFSALNAIMFIGIGLQKKREAVAKRLSAKYGKLWGAAEVFLFVLVGATVNINYLEKFGTSALIVITGALIFRMFLRKLFYLIEVFFFNNILFKFVLFSK